MAITEKDEELIEYGFIMAFLPDLPRNDETADKVLAAWNQLWTLMIRENNFSDMLGSSVLDWQIGNWANDVTVYLNNVGRYRDVISVNKQILKIDWKRSGDSDLFYENAKRDIADAYASMGNIQKSYELYEEYLEKDPLWGWGWIGYYRQLNDNDDSKYSDVIEDLYDQIVNGIRFRDMEDLCRELSDEFETLGDTDKSCYLAKCYEQESNKKHAADISSLLRNIGFKEKKIYPNEPCPCGSGKKYKKCCGKK